MVTVVGFLASVTKLNDVQLSSEAINSFAAAAPLDSGMVRLTPDRKGVTLSLYCF